MKALGMCFAALLMVGTGAFAEDTANTIAKLRQESPWIPADSKVVMASDGTWKILDNVKVAFVDDPQVVGAWKAVDYVSEVDQFNPYEKGFSGDLFWKTVEFQKGGFQVSYFGTFKNASNRWTKGLYLSTNPNEPTAAKYEIQKIADQDFLFIEWKSGDYQLRAKKPGLYVFSR